MTTEHRTFFNHPLFPELERLIIQLVTTSPSFEVATEHYRKCSGLIPDWMFVLALPNGSTPGVVANRNFSATAAIRTAMSGDFVYFLDRDTLKEMEGPDPARIAVDYSIALDTQAVSYLVPFLRSNGAKPPNDMAEVFAFLAQNHVRLDPLPYMIENLPKMHAPEHAAKVYETLEAYQRLRTIDAGYFASHGAVCSKLSPIDLQREVEAMKAGFKADAQRREIIETIHFRQQLMFAILLKTVCIQLLHPAWSLGKKVSCLLEFMDTRLDCIFLREVILAARYFSLDRGFAFFSKMQRKRRLSAMLNDLTSMSWDYWHVHHLEEAMGLRPDPNARYFLAALLTFDKRYGELLQLSGLKALAHTRDGRRLPVHQEPTFGPGTESIEKELAARFYSDAARARRTKATQEALRSCVPGLVNELTRELSRACLA